MPRIRIAAVSDIHGNAPALRAVLADARKRGYDLIAQLGDAFSGPLWPSQTADLLRSIDAVHVRGNHDTALIDPALEPPVDADRFALGELSSEVLDWIRTWPSALPVGSDALLFHGSPQSANYYLFDEAPHGDARLRPAADIERDLADVTARVCIGGHSLWSSSAMAGWRSMTAASACRRFSRRSRGPSVVATRTAVTMPGMHWSISGATSCRCPSWRSTTIGMSLETRLRAKGLPTGRNGSRVASGQCTAHRED
jgi:hypothetical protein